jgi:hypothetical protein
MSTSKTILQRDQLIERLNFTGGTSQWLNAPPYRSCYLVVEGASAADWSVQGKLPNGQNAELGSYLNEQGPFDPAGGAGYITMNAMCGLPIRFVASAPQPNAEIWVVLKA